VRPVQKSALLAAIQKEIQMGSDGHVDSTIESAIFQQLFFGRFERLNCTLVPRKLTGSVQ
jgi:hypothetical protein